jgi:hypothetical protein
MVDAFVAPGRSRRETRRVLCFVPVAMAMLLALMPAVPGRAQVVVSAGPSVTVTGTGEATVSASTATVQILIGQSRQQFELSQDGSGSSFGIEAEEVGDGDFAAMLEAEADATPQTTPEMAVTEEDADAPEEGRRGRRERGERPEPRPIDAERLAPVIAAIASSGGIAPEAVTIDLSPLATEPFGDRRESARLDFEVAQPDPEALTAMITSASDVAAADGLVIRVAGVLYNPDDCAVVEQEAAEAALVDAEEQAGRLGDLLGVTLGGVVSASTNPYFGIDPEVSGCSGQQSSFFDSSYGGLGITVPVFDPFAPAEVEVYAVLTVSYEIVESELA